MTLPRFLMLEKDGVYQDRLGTCVVNSTTNRVSHARFTRFTQGVAGASVAVTVRGQLAYEQVR
jgi:hypothetical protein